jgi:uncharacterized integral membrane protein
MARAPSGGFSRTFIAASTSTLALPKTLDAAPLIVAVVLFFFLGMMLTRSFGHVRMHVRPIRRRPEC